MRTPLRQYIPGGLQEGKSITVKGRVLLGADSFYVNLQCGDGPKADVALHFSARFDKLPGYVVLNTFHQDIWGKECKYEWPIPRGSTFTLKIVVNRDSYLTFVNEIFFLEYHHRLPVSSVNTIWVDGGVDLESVEFPNASFPGYGFDLESPAYNQGAFSVASAYNQGASSGGFAYAKGASSGALAYTEGQYYGAPGYNQELSSGAFAYNQGLSSESLAYTQNQSSGAFAYTQRTSSVAPAYNQAPSPVPPIYIQAPSPVAPAYNQAPSPVAPAYSQAPSPVASIYSQAPPAGAPAYNQAPSPVAPAYNQAPSPVPPIYIQAPSPVAPAYNQAPSPVAPAYNQAPSPVAPAYSQAPSPGAPAYNQAPSPVAPAYNQAPSPVASIYNRSPSPVAPMYNRAPAPVAVAYTEGTCGVAVAFIQGSSPEAPENPKSSSSTAVACSSGPPLVTPYKRIMEGGMYHGRSITVKGVMRLTANTFFIALCFKNGVAFQFSPKFDKSRVVCNSQLKQKWGSEERMEGLPFCKGQPFTVNIFCEVMCYRVSINSLQTITFKHRYRMLNEIDILEIDGDVSLTSVEC